MDTRDNPFSELVAKGEISDVARRIGKDGKAYPGEVVKITTSEPAPEPPPPPWKDKLFCPADALELLPHEPKQHYDLILAEIVRNFSV